MSEHKHTIVRADRSDPYFASPRSTPQDNRLSVAATAFLFYLFSKPDDWEIMPIDLQKRFKIGREKTQKTLTELRQLGYIVTERVKNEAGQYTGTVHYLYQKPVTTTRDSRTVDSHGDGKQTLHITDTTYNREGITPSRVTPALTADDIRSRVIETIITQGRSTNANQLAGMIGREYEDTISDVLGELLNEALIEPGAMGTYTATKTDAQREAERAFIRSQQAEEDLPPYLKTIDPALRSMLAEVEKHFGVAAWKARWMTEMLAGVAKEKQGDWHLHNVYPGLTADDVGSLAKYIRQGLLKGDENMTLPQKAETLSSEAYKWIAEGKKETSGLVPAALHWAKGEGE